MAGTSRPVQEMAHQCFGAGTQALQIGKIELDHLEAAADHRSVLSRLTDEDGIAFRRF